MPVCLEICSLSLLMMSMTFASIEPVAPAVVDEWRGTVLWRSTRNPYRPGHNPGFFSGPATTLERGNPVRKFAGPL